MLQRTELGHWTGECNALQEPNTQDADIEKATGHSDNFVKSAKSYPKCIFEAVEGGEEEVRWHIWGARRRFWWVLYDLNIIKKEKGLY